MQCLILAGGLGTRMRPLTDTCPKTLIPVAGRPFAWHQLQWLARQGVTEVLYSIGHMGGMIQRFWNQEPWPVPSIRYVDEGERLLGTGGAVKLAFDQGMLRDQFLVLYGDSFLPIRFGPFWKDFRAKRKPAMMTILRNEGRWDRSNVLFENGRIVLYDKNPTPQMRHIDSGLSAFHCEVFRTVPAGRFDLATLFNNLSLAGDLAGFEVTERFYEIGSPQGLKDLEAWLSTENEPKARMTQ